MTTRQPDNWGWKARIGMFIVSSEAVPEADWWAMVPPDVSIHAARVTASTPWAKWSDQDDASVTLEEDVRRGVEQFSKMQLSAVVSGHSSSSIVGGGGWDSALVAKLSASLPETTAVTTNGLDCQAALRASNVKRPYLIFPAWFNTDLVAAGLDYFSSKGFAPSATLRFDPGRQWRDVAPEQLYPQGMGFEQDVESLYRQIRCSCPSEADGVLIAGTGFRCVAIIQALEDDLQRPVISANQASLWHCLRLSGVHTSVTGYGKLLEKL